MRVIAGSARGTVLHTPKSDVRPTMGMVKSAIFSSLADLLPGARVLDLFAGTGALGIEALSRGAASVSFVETDRNAIESIERNLAKTQLQGTVFRMDIFSFLDRFASSDSFDLIFADPPYMKKPGERDFTPELLASAALHRALAPGGVFVLEHLPGAKLSPGPWQCFRQKRYGGTGVAFLRHPGAVA